MDWFQLRIQTSNSGPLPLFNTVRGNWHALTTLGECRLVLVFHSDYLYHVFAMVCQGYRNVIRTDANVTVLWNILQNWCVIFARRKYCGPLVAKDDKWSISHRGMQFRMTKSFLKVQSIMKIIVRQEIVLTRRLPWLDQSEHNEWVGREVHAQMFQAKLQKKKRAQKIGILENHVLPCSIKCFSWTSQTCLSRNTCVCPIAFILVLLDDSVQITARRQRSVKAPENCKNSHKQVVSLCWECMRKSRLGLLPSTALFRLPEL